MSTTAIVEDVTEQLRELGARIRATREFRGLTQDAVSNKAGIGLQTYVRIEDGYSGIGALNLAKVLRALGLEESMVPASVPSRPETAMHDLHLASEEVDQAIEEAVSAACESLDGFLKVTYPEREGIGSDFQGILRQHISAMLCGEHGAKQRHASQLPQLIYSNDSVGGPQWDAKESNNGWVLRLRGTAKVLHGSRLVGVGHSELDPFSSRHDALQGFRQFIERVGHPPGPVDAVPVYVINGERYSFSPNTMKRTPMLDDASGRKFTHLLHHIAEQIGLQQVEVDQAVLALYTVYGAIESSDSETLQNWLADGERMLGTCKEMPLGRHGKQGEFIEGRDLVSFLKRYVVALHAHVIRAEPFAEVMEHFFAAADDGNSGEVRRCIQRGRNLTSATS